MSQRLDYASPPAPSPRPRLVVPLVAVLFAAGSVVPSLFIWRRAFDHSRGGGYFEEVALLELALALGGIVCGSISLFVGLRHRHTLVVLLGLLALVVSLASLGMCGTSPLPSTVPPP